MKRFNPGILIALSFGLTAVAPHAHAGPVFLSVPGIHGSQRSPADPCGPACTPAALGPAAWIFDDGNFPPGFSHRPDFSFHTDNPPDQQCNPVTPACSTPEPDPPTGPVFTADIINLSPTPEPATFGLIGTAMLGLGLTRRKRK